ncbi:uncharacterized protein [Montipora capricornis]|uniref:uncharacterized protein n=1 Tax=Montipora capricornis TaxID=246305 RepID=UPI0035F1BA82
MTEEEEYDLDRQLRFYSDESSDDEFIGDQSTPNTTSFLTAVETNPVSTSSTASATSAGQLVTSVSQILSPPVATSVQSSVAGPSSHPVGSFYATRAVTRAAPRNVPCAATAVPQIGKGKGRGGKRGKGPAARAPATPAAASALAPFLSYDDPDIDSRRDFPASLKKGKEWGKGLSSRQMKCNNQGLIEDHCSTNSRRDFPASLKKGKEWGKGLSSRQMKCNNQGLIEDHCSTNSRRDFPASLKKGKEWGKGLSSRQMKCNNQGLIEDHCSTNSRRDFPASLKKGKEWGKGLSSRQMKCNNQGLIEDHCSTTKLSGYLCHMIGNIFLRSIKC